MFHHNLQEFSNFLINLCEMKCDKSVMAASIFRNIFYNGEPDATMSLLQSRIHVALNDYFLEIILTNIFEKQMPQ